VADAYLDGFTPQLPSLDQLGAAPLQVVAPLAHQIDPAGAKSTVDVLNVKGFQKLKVFPGAAARGSSRFPPILFTHTTGTLRLAARSQFNKPMVIYGR